MKLHLFNYANIELHRCSGVELRVGEFKKDSRSPFFTEEFFSNPRKPWEVRYDNSYPNVIFDPLDQRYRLYYTLFIEDHDAANSPLELRPDNPYLPRGDRVTGVCYAESNDGITWTKPNLGIIDFHGSRNNNILFKHAHGTGVFLDEFEADPNRRYKLVTKLEYSTQNHFMAVAFSRDGVSFSEPIPWRNYNPKADTHNNVFRDPFTHEYILITRIIRDGIRVVAKSTSRDFLTWSEPVEVMRGRGPGAQIYSMPVAPYDGIYLGFPSIYRDGDRSAPEFDLVDLGLAFSRTTDHWELLADGASPLPRGSGRYPTGEFDAGCIYAGAPLLAGDELVLYYMGGNGQHTNHRETSFARATIHRDKLAYYTSRNAEEGVLQVGPMSVYGSRIETLVEVDEDGWIEYEIAARNGESLPGFERSTCRRITSSGLHQLHFNGTDTGGFAGRTAYLRLYLNSARAYTVQGDVAGRHML